MRIINARVFNEDCRFEEKDVCTESGFFSEASRDGEVLDAGGKYLIPALTDIHFHGCMGHDFCEGTEEAIRVLADYELAHGVTQICPATMTYDEETLMKIMKAAAAHSNAEGADLVGIQLEGPFISYEKKGAQNGKYICAPDTAFFRRLQEASGNLIRIADVAPEAEGAMEFIDAIHGDAVISIAHTAADYETAREAIRRGASHVTHLYNAMPPLAHRAPGVAAAAAENENVMPELICDGIHIHPAMVRMTFRMFSDRRIIFISDSMEATGLSDGEYTLGGQGVTVHGHHALLHDGTLAGSATCLFDCFRTAVLTMGIPLESAVRCAAVNPAKSIGIFDAVGSISAGKKANFLLLDGSIRLTDVYKDGVRR